MEEKDTRIGRRFLQSTQAKTNWVIIIVILLAVGVVMGLIKIPSLGDIQLPFSITGDQPGEAPAGTTSVTKRLQFSWVDKYAGTALASDTFYVYDGETNALLESLTTDSDGIKQTAKTYPSGKSIKVLYHQGNALVWIPVVVPYMSVSDAEANTYNDIPLEAFAIGTYTSDTLMSGGTTYADSSEFNITTVGNTNPVWTYQLSNTGSDNTGLMNSFDPVYQQNLRTCVVATFTGTGYESVVLNNWDSQFTLGSTLYGVKYFDTQALTKWKVGSSYVSGYEGSDVVSFSMDLTGIAAGDSVTMQLTCYAYADPDYAVSHGGSVGNSEVTIAEQTVTINIAD